MTNVRVLLPLLVSTFAACGSAPMPQPALPEGTGRGLLTADAEPPADAITYPRPTWHVGDTFALVRGEVATGDFTVEAIDEQGYVIRGSGGVRMRRDLDLGNLGEWQPDGDQPLHLLSPVDVRFHWPLWVGKRWQCEYVDRAAGGPAMTMLADYEVEDLDRVTVRAGTFDALRIVRTLRLPAAGDRVMTRTQLIWYAPSIGTEVRQVLGDTEVELVAWRPAS
jgi:hypothetical protein